MREFTVGSLVQARGREWVVLPDSTEDLLVLRPLGGTDQEIAGIYLPLEGDDVRPATFDLPDPSRPGDFRSGRMLRDAVRLGFRSSAGPFRSFARLNVEPRPYQLVPLLMALKLDPIRILIADDVGIGKTIEAGLIARELLDRGEVQRLAVLCPPHLAEQWQSELADKFHIEAELVLPSTAPRLERHTAVGQSLFDIHPYTVVSTEYIKSTRRRDEFVRACPPLVIVDEAHTCAFSEEGRGGRHLRYELLRSLSASPDRHLILVTATPHSGKEGAFRSLLGFLRRDFLDLPEDLSGRDHERFRREVAAHLVQRRRADVRAYMDAQTFFPEREDTEQTYTLSNEYKKLFNTLLDYAREHVMDPTGSEHRRRVRWWSALALLRSLASSPAAAAATLRTRSATVETETAEEADIIGERAVLDLDDSDASEFLDTAPGGLGGDDQPESERDRLLRYARRADELFGPEHDFKLRRAIPIVKGLLDDGFNPILFCRFIPTALYVADQLRQALPRGVEVAAVTGLLPPAEREKRVELLGIPPKHVLVATDCLSEGINLQQHFDAVMHYDLSWNPTRHEQREGRADRFGQPSNEVRTVTYYGTDNQIDGIVLDVLLRKHKAIRTSLGISVPVPANTGEVIEALMNGLLLRGSQADSRQLAFDFLGDLKLAHQLQIEWEDVSQKEKESRTLFAQRAIKVEDVAQEYRAVRDAIGTHVDVRRFMTDAVRAHGGFVTERDGVLEFNLPEAATIREACGNREQFTARFEMPVSEGVLYLPRTHPIVEGLATYVMDGALDPLMDGAARRCGAIRTRAVGATTTLLLLRLRYHIVAGGIDGAAPLLAEDCRLVGFTGSPRSPQWLEPAAAEALLDAQPDANIAPQQATQFIRHILDGMPDLAAPLTELAERRGREILDAHQRVRTAARLKGVRYDVRPQLPPDILGAFILLPVGE
ncbi:MAG: DEAD/DEAH box helicase [Deltaproteobacteria bacterium]|nr:DEAD/DEAH box helicase [Deltaproteobacteria bacterium]